MSSVRVNFIGCGKLGKTVAKLIAINNLAKVNAIVTTSISSSTEAVRFVGQGTVCSSLREIPPADIYFITTRDDAIEAVCNQLANDDLLSNGAIVVHCSGSLSSDALLLAKRRNCDVVSIHPIKSFANPSECVNTFAGTPCAIEGDVRAVTLIKNLFEKLGANVFAINKSHKKLYHIGGVLANNYLVTLHYQALECYKAAGVDEKISKQIVSKLMSETLNNLEKFTHKQVLTGPIQRGDTQTIKNHMLSLGGYPATRRIYASLGLGTLPLTLHSSQKLEKIKDTLDATLGENTSPSTSGVVKLRSRL